jgi:hypothetical protein
MTHGSRLTLLTSQPLTGLLIIRKFNLNFGKSYLNNRNPDRKTLNMKVTQIDETNSNTRPTYLLDAPNYLNMQHFACFWQVNSA